MKKIILILAILLIGFFLFGCTENTTNTTNNNQNLSNESQWSSAVAELGNPTYKEVEIESGYKILPFPGLAYNGLRDGWQAFYATNSDYSFAIYASPSVNINAGTYEEVKQKVKDEYSPYSDNLSCADNTNINWLTKAQVFTCEYSYQGTINYKIVTFYKNNSYIKTSLSVWGGYPLNDYVYIFDEFNQKAVSWN
ncbi:MAG: hypothetical protein JW703_02550 [Candidatus Diapherotrites archaeon]|nr:hypothetical protein [Candidatus Diapherotrites archaeon]